MSVPDNSRPKAPPSLLADTPARPAGAPASGTPAGSRILANLEGRVVPQPMPAGKTPQRSSKAAGLVALLVIGAGAFGAWHWMSRTPSSTSNAASTAASAVAVAAASATPASHAVVASAQKNAPEEASASHAATIVADDDSASAGGENERLARVLADGSASGATAPAAPAAPVAQTAQAAPEKSAAKHQHDSADTKHQTANAHKNDSKADSKTALAQSKKAHANGKKDDSDADLLAVLFARSKPTDAKTGSHASKGSAKGSEANASLAQQVKACSERGFFEDQLCRWRVCDGHWGKDPACPQAAKASNEH
ncbi:MULTISPECIES: hypothetical protein [unclassified Paraburkholderia]|uniref:hypothetical protein n=1 Tax=unclassified Paraburkholderia TaxID=2615204 RepID=UPI002AB2386D|nr:MULTISPECIES: hypothetical protein [unclassified Paraburkholderia]